MITCKFNLGQQVRHRLTGALGVIVDMDAEYSLDTPAPETIFIHPERLSKPWYYVVMEEESGETIHTYIAEFQLTGEVAVEHLDQPTLDDIADQVRRRVSTPSHQH